VAWFIATIGVFGLSLAMGGARTQGAVSQNAGAKYESIRAWDLYGGGSPIGTSPAGQSVYLVVNSPTQKVTDPAYAQALGDIAGQLKNATATVDGSTVPVFDTVTDPLTAPPTAGLVSEDLSSARIVAFAAGEGIALSEKLDGIPDLTAALRAKYPDLEIHALSNSLANTEISELVNHDLDGSLRLTLPITFIILLIAFGALVAALVPLVLAVTALLAAFGILNIYSQLIDPVSPYASQLIVLIGLAVAVDYSLFMVTRARHEWRRGRDRHERDRNREQHRRTGGLLQRPGGHDLDRRPVPPRRSALPIDGDRDHRRCRRLRRRLPDVPAGGARDPRHAR
jgi:RND superfamily putative drug exporter